MKLNLSVDEVLTTTRAVRKRLDLTRPVPRAIIEECMELALQAPNGSNRNLWRFIIVDDPALIAARIREQAAVIERRPKLPDRWPSVPEMTSAIGRFYEQLGR